MMAGTLTREVLARTAKRPTVRYGTISSASSGLANVRIGSTVVENATWLSGYLPSVGDRVAVLASGTGWLILDAVESAQRAYNEPETTLVMPDRGGRVTNILWSDSWDDSLNTPEPDPKVPEPRTDGWDRLGTFGLDGSWHHFVNVGYHYAQMGTGDVVNYIPANGYNAEFLWYPDLADQVPGNAVIQSVSLVLRLWAPSPSMTDPFLPAPGMPIKVYGHSQPREGTTTGGVPPEAYLSSTHIIDAGTADAGDLVTVPLTDDMVDDLVSGALTGLALWPGETQKRVVFEDDGTWAWEKPYPNSPGGYAKTYTTSDCFGLQVTYVTPYEDGA